LRFITFLNQKTPELDSMLINKIKKLIELVQESEIDEIEVTRWGTRIRIRKNPVPGNPSYAAPVETVSVVSPVTEKRETIGSGGTETVEMSTEEKVVVGANEQVVKAPMVGTFYSSPSPDAAAFVEVGSKVTIGKTLCIVEAMKLMNEIPSEINGVINKILVENGEPVEYGQELFVIGT
jgi:acetyl-CoA carboxylase biotin carboxyl carrier protein